MKVSFSVEMSLKELSQSPKGALSIEDPAKSESVKRTYFSHWWKKLRICVSRVEEKLSAAERADLAGCKSCFIPTLYIGRVIPPKILLIKKLI